MSIKSKNKNRITPRKNLLKTLQYNKKKSRQSYDVYIKLEVVIEYLQCKKDKEYRINILQKDYLREKSLKLKQVEFKFCLKYKYKYAALSKVNLQKYMPIIVKNN